MAEPALKIETDDDWSMSNRRERAVMRQSEQIHEQMDPVPEERPFPSSRGKLTKAEIEALLRPDLPEELDDEPAAAAPETRSFSMFDEQATLAQSRDDEDARAIAASLSLGLRQDCQLPAAARVVGLSTGEFSDVFAGSRQGGVCLFFQNELGQIAAAMSLSAELTTSLIDIACGGEGATSGLTGRALTSVDGEMLSALLAPLAASLGSDYSLARTETDARFASAMAPPGAAEIIDLSVTLSGLEVPARLAVLHAASPSKMMQQIEDPAMSFATALLTARIASLSVPVSRLANLKPGATLLLGIPADQPVELLSGGRDGLMAAEGEIGRKGNSIAIRITRRGAYLRNARRRAAQEQS